MPNASEPLFRIEPALAGQRRECAAFNSSPKLFACLHYGLCGAIALGAYYGFAQELARKTTLPGRAEIIGGEIKIHADAQRVVESLWVSDGELVAKGQLLAILKRPDHLTSAAGMSREQSATRVLTDLTQQLKRLSESRSRALEASAAEKEAIGDRLVALNQRLKLLNQQRSALKRRLDLSQQALERGKTLFSTGHLAAVKLDELEHQRADLKTDYLRSSESRLLVLEAIRSTTHQHEQLAYTLADKQSAIDAQIGERRREQARLRSTLEQHITAPVHGVVTGILSHVGNQVTPATPFITMMKGGSRFQAKLWAQSEAAGELRIGTSVNIMVDAFPHQKHGMLAGTIEHINESPLLRRELGEPHAEPGLNYALTVLLDHSSPLYSKLRSGMSIRADVKLDKSRLVDRLFEPLTKAWRRSL